MIADEWVKKTKGIMYKIYGYILHNPCPVITGLCNRIVLCDYVLIWNKWMQQSSTCPLLPLAVWSCLSPAALARWWLCPCSGPPATSPSWRCTGAGCRGGGCCSVNHGYGFVTVVWSRRLRSSVAIMSQVGCKVLNKQVLQIQGGNWN